MERVVVLNINGQQHSVAVHPSATLQNVLRNNLGLTGTKKGCQLGVCGSCTVLLDGEPVNSCLVLAVETEGCEIITIEGISDGNKLHPVQQAFVDVGAIQCGYCTPGMVMSGIALLNRKPDPSDQEIKEAFGGNLCRCTGYTRIVEAIRRCRPGNKASADRQDSDDNELSVVGKSVPRTDAIEKVTGRAQYAGDIRLPNMLYAKMLLSPHPHARIKSISTEKAEQLPGVKAVITGRDVPDVLYGVSPARYDEYVLAKDKVRHVGDEVACVAAVDEDTAIQALELIEVDYEVLPAVFDPFEAIKDGAPSLHEKARNNINAEVHQHFGDVEKGFAEADYIREDRFRTQRTVQAPIEPHACLAHYDESGKLTLWTATQTPHYVQHQLHRVLGLPMGKIRVIKPYLGGGFGGKAETTSAEFCASIISMRTGRPVQIVYRRDEVFMHGRGRHAMTVDLKTGVKKDGTITAVQEKAVLDGGAYTSFGIITVYYAGNMMPTLYHLPSFKFDGYRVYTNLPACGAQRGHGTPQPRFAFESQLSMIADDLGIDQIEIRRRNAMEPDSVTVNELKIGSCEFLACLNEVERASGWKKKKDKLPPGRGIGVGAGGFVSGAGYPIYRSSFPHSNAFIKISEDGSTATLFVGAADIGQGSDTVLTQIAAEELGMRYEDFSIVAADTEITPRDLGTYSSRVTLMAGNAVRMAAERAKRPVLEVAAENLECAPDDLTSRDGKIFITNDPKKSIAFQEAATEAFNRNGVITGSGHYEPPRLGGGYKGAAVGTSPAYSFGAAVAEVEVDLETGKVRMLNFTDAHDVGQPINPMAVHGQVEGCASMGLGETVFEEVVHDHGRLVNPNLHEYIIPGVMEMPDIKSIIVPSREPAGPFGAKEVGEGAMLPVMGAIANAIADATGVRIKDLPITPEKILAALKKQKKENKD